MGDLLKLPRELRDEIYKHVLVRQMITVSDTWHNDCPALLRNMWIDCDNEDCNNNNEHREPYNFEDLDSNEPRTRQCYDIECSECYENTYLWAVSFDTEDQSERIYLAILSTNHQIYLESSMVFYSSNVFGFNFHNEVDATRAFMSDRPRHARESMNRIAMRSGHFLNYPQFYSHLGLPDHLNPRILRGEHVSIDDISSLDVLSLHGGPTIIDNFMEVIEDGWKDTNLSSYPQFEAQFEAKGLCKYVFHSKALRAPGEEGITVNEAKKAILWGANEGIIIARTPKPTDTRVTHPFTISIIIRL